jgi:hypothetical protein
MASDARSNGPRLLVLLLLGLFAYAVGLSFFTVGWSADANYRNVSIDTRVNITGSAPTITQVQISTPIVLNAGNLTIITCKLLVRDYNGYDDIRRVNATLFHQTSSEYAADENNTHYTNTSCSNITSEQGGYYGNYTCTFLVNYYALNGTWNCTAHANDSRNLLSLPKTNSSTISPLYALNVTTTLLDFGNVAGNEYSNNVTANVTNLGNININISVKGYGRTMGDGYSFVCDQGTLSVDLMHFAANTSANYAGKQNLSTTTYQSIYGLTINKTTNANVSLNSTYWELYAEPTQVAFGMCNGTIIFQASAS